MNSKEPLDLRDLKRGNILFLEDTDGCSVRLEITKDSRGGEEVVRAKLIEFGSKHQIPIDFVRGSGIARATWWILGCQNYIPCCEHERFNSIHLNNKNLMLGLQVTFCFFSCK